MATLAAVLSEDNRALLRLIRKAKPKTMTELAALSGRQVPNLSRTLRMMEGYGLVALTKNARQTRPTALATEFATDCQKEAGEDLGKVRQRVERAAAELAALLVGPSGPATGTTTARPAAAQRRTDPFTEVTPFEDLLRGGS